jgi:hypothetical protein
MTPDEFRDALNSGNPFEVRIRGYVVGATSKRGFATDSRGGFVTDVAPGEFSICAEVRVDGAEVQNFDTSFNGTSLSIEKHGGGVLRVPIERIELLESVPAEAK